MAIEKYRLSNFDYEVTIEVDREIATEERLSEINDFWCDNNELIKNFGSVLNAVLVRVFRTAQRFACEPFGFYDPVRQFAELEGWPPMDGKYGIKILSFDNEFPLDDEPVIQKLETA